MLFRRRDPSNAYSNGPPFGAPFDGLRRGLDLRRSGGARQGATCGKHCEVDAEGHDSRQRRYLLIRHTAPAAHRAVNDPPSEANSTLRYTPGQSGSRATSRKCKREVLCTPSTRASPDDAMRCRPGGMVSIATTPPYPLSCSLSDLSGYITRAASLGSVAKAPPVGNASPLSQAGTHPATRSTFPCSDKESRQAHFTCFSVPISTHGPFRCRKASSRHQRTPPPPISPTSLPALTPGTDYPK